MSIMPIHPGAIVPVARHIGLSAHDHDRDKLGHPYYLHLKAVAAGVEVLGGDDATVAAAWLHDALEDHRGEWVGDTLLTADGLLTRGFPTEVVDTVVAVTHLPGQDDVAYMRQVIDGGRRSQVLKLADLLHNTRPDRVARLVAIRPNAEEWSERRYRWKIEALMVVLGIIREGAPCT